MSDERILIVGAGPAGVAIARSYRECGGAAPVSILGREPHLPYERPPLTKEYLRGELAETELGLEERSWYDEQDVELRLGCEITAIEPRTGQVRCGAETLQGAKIVLATGSAPVRPRLAGIEHARVLSVRELADSRRISERVKAGSHALVIGSGFIGCEIAASLVQIGARIALVSQEEAPQQERLGPGAARRIGDWLRELGVELFTSVEVRSIEEGRAALLDDGRRLEAEWILLGTGAAPRGQLAEAAGCAVEDGAVLVDARMRAGERLLAVGDVAFAHNVSAHRRLRVEHWGTRSSTAGSRAGRSRGRTRSGRRYPASGRRSASTPSSTRPGATAMTPASSSIHGDGAFTVWYTRSDVLVGVLSHDRDEDYERGRELIRQEAARP